MFRFDATRRAQGPASAQFIADIDALCQHRSACNGVRA